MKYLVALIPFSLFACYTPRYIYSPPATNVPVLVKKGDNKLAAYYSTLPFSNTAAKHFYNYGFDIQAAYALSKHWGILFNVSKRFEKNSGDFDFFHLDSSFIKYKRILLEFGGGYFTPVSPGSKMNFQLMGGIGTGKFNMDDTGRNNLNQYYSRFHETLVTKVFLQPALQLRYSKYFSTSFATRFIILWYHNIKTNYTPVELDAFLLSELKAAPKTFLEPAIINSFGFKKLPAYLFELQLGLTSLTSHRFLDYRSVNFSIGAMVDFSKIRTKRK